MKDLRHSGGEVNEVVRLTDHLFRHESGRLVSVLTGIFGVGRLQLAEDVVQEAMARALKTWPYYGIPENPVGWLMQTARHLALDLIRREKRFQCKQQDLGTYLEERLPSDETANVRFESELQDDRLRLMFACCHPRLPVEMQTALALKTLCGFSAREIASAFLSTEAAIAKRLTRARNRLQAEDIRFEIPAGPELAERLDGVLQTVYLLFNEGYKASDGECILRRELCAEAIRLTEQLAAHPEIRRPRVHALLALMLLSAARLPARVAGDGQVICLEEQDRGLWDRFMIQRGIFHLGQAVGGDELCEFHLEAAIAACHCLAKDAAGTDWRRILSLYDRLAEINGSPVIALNRAVALAKVEGFDVGIKELQAVLERESLETYYWSHAVLGDLERQRKRFPEAVGHFRRAMELAGVNSERAFFKRRLEECAAHLN